MCRRVARDVNQGAQHDANSAQRQQQTHSVQPGVLQVAGFQVMAAGDLPPMPVQPASTTTPAAAPAKKKKKPKKPKNSDGEAGGDGAEDENAIVDMSMFAAAAGSGSGAQKKTSG